jgi:hypothetical protein
VRLSRIIKIYLFPVLFLILPAVLGLCLELYNRYYRGLSTPFLYPSLGLILISLFFWVKKRWLYFALILLTAVYLVFFFRYTLWSERNPPSWVYYYQDWQFDTQSGRIKLKTPLGNYPPASGTYLSCNFALKNRLSYLNAQPVLCTAFDSQLRLKMFLNEHQTDEGTLREFQVNEFRVDRKSLLGEPLDRSALRIAFVPEKSLIFPKYRAKAIYQVYEREISPNRYKIVESFSRNAQGELKSFTESPDLKFTSGDVYAVYNADGILVKIPMIRNRNFSFPAQVDIRRYRNYELPKLLGQQ